jgi:hypothetical protein
MAVALAVPIVLGSLLAAWDLGTKPLWYDETFEALLVMHPPKKFAYWIATFETTGAFYHSLLWLWKFIGTNELILRVPSLIFAVAALPVTFFVGRRFLGVPWASVAAILLAVSALWFGHAQEARPYAAFLFMSGLSTLTLMRSTESPSRGRWVTYAVITVLAVWTHLMMAFVVMAQVIAMTAHPQARTWWRSAALSVLVVALSALPIAYSITHAVQSRWDWLQGPTPEGLWAGARHLASDPGNVLTLVWLGLWAAGMAIGQRRFWIDRAAGWPILMVALTSVLAVVGPWLGSFFREMYAPRYIFEALAPMILLATLTLSALRPRIIGAAAAIALIATGLYVTVSWHGTLGWPDFRAAVRVIVDEGGPQDGLAYFYNGPFEPGARYELRYYLTQTPGAEDRPTMVLLANATDSLEQRVDAAIAGYQRLFFVGTPNAMDETESLAALAEIERSFYLTRTYDVHGLDVRLYTRASP